MTPAFISLASHFSLLKLRVYAQLAQDTQLPSFKGSMLHGWLGHALKFVDEKAFHVLFGEHDQQQPKPYMLLPGPDLKTQWRKGEIYTFELVLFGDATNFADRLVEACNLGHKFGLGPERCAFTTVCIGSVLNNQITPGLHPQHLIDYLPAASTDQPIAEVALNIETPIRLKQHGKILMQASPSLEQWIQHILRRWKLLSQFWVVDDPQLYHALGQELPSIGDYEQVEHLYYENWERYSHKGKQQLPFGGLKGQTSFYGDIARAIPWLQVGQYLHVGGKTTFGLGQFSVIA